MTFFVSLISSVGDCLSPLDNPSLPMGFIRDAPFLWSLHLFPILISNLVILLTVF